MAVLAECPQCHRKQATRNKACSCGRDLDKAKRSKLVRYWIQYRLPGGKQRKEFVGDSIEEARDADGKRRVQKRENRIFDIKPEAKMTFQQLTDWYLGLEKVKARAYYGTLQINMDSFNSEFGNVIVNQIKAADLENYQAKRKSTGYADSYVDQEIGAARTMINKAFDNNLVGGDTLKTFKGVKRLLKRNGNARNKILPLDQFNLLLEELPQHTKAILATGFYTGMRKGEILGLTWDKVDLKNRLIRLEAKDTKDNEPRNAPICDELYRLLISLPSRLRDSTQNDYVFQYRGKPVKDIRSALKRACKKVGITYGRFAKDGFVFHDLRHTFNTYMRKSGVPESVIMEITGHSTREMFDRYNTVDAEDARLAIEKLQVYLANVTQNVTQASHEEETSPTCAQVSGCN
jgi:integrase